MSEFNCKLEYLWLDGYETPNIRSKTKYTTIATDNKFITVEDIPEWGFDGSSTLQAEGGDSDCILQPVKVYPNTVDDEEAIGMNSFIVLCEVFDTKGGVHPSNRRAALRRLSETYSGSDMWFGIEQEYTFMNVKSGRPFGWSDQPSYFPPPQGRYYCGVGADAVGTTRNLVARHAQACLAAGIPVCGTNAEVMLGQWEYQVGVAGPVDIADSLWVARYMLEVLAEREGIGVSLAPKPVHGDWNGSGAHINFSTTRLRDQGGEKYINSIVTALEHSHSEHIKAYGVDNDQRLTGNHETANINVFTCGDSDRGASIRVPPKTAASGKGYLEDRRPASNIDPYAAVAAITKTVGSVDAGVEAEVPA